jgi:hypothetical protein
MTFFGAGFSSVKINPSKEATVLIVLIYEVIATSYIIP